VNDDKIEEIKKLTYLCCICSHLHSAETCKKTKNIKKINETGKLFDDLSDEYG